MFESQCHTDPSFYNAGFAAEFKAISIKQASIVHAGMLKYNMIQSNLVLMNIIAPANQNLV
jgi:hypothetical protein